jgi:hypothetical protein
MLPESKKTTNKTKNAHNNLPAKDESPHTILGNPTVA